jgi:two-component system, cell cycle sensor histidine kinase and response regulator CckA
MPTSHPTGTILLVDDEDGIRVTLRRLLTAHGHSVLEASHGEEAIAVVRMRRGNLDMVLADVVMPEMNGTELAATIAKEFPGLPVILMSAYAPAGLTRIGPGNQTVPVLQKPFAPGQVEELVQVALELPVGRRRENRPAGAV